jgi:hypothetical protein
MVYVKSYYAEAPDKAHEDISYGDLRQKCLTELNTDPDLHDSRIISIDEVRGFVERRPVINNSDTWYNTRWINLHVFYEKT